MKPRHSPRLSTALALVGALAVSGRAGAREPSRPNMIWITSEDNGPHLGCYGDAFATTPHLDALARRGMIYMNAWSNVPVCAPARTALISGLYPNSTGSEHMRSQVRPPPFLRMYPQLLREAGYYCTNNSKEDYNLEKPGQVWDESSPRAHWRNRKAGQPFFAVINHTVTHESQVRKRPHTPRHNANGVRVPAYHPDTPEVRGDWAQYYDKLTEMDALAGANLKELADSGLADDTIIFYYGDHGPGLPRCKRSACDSGLRVPLIVYVPPRYRSLAPADYQPGARSNRLVSFVDLGPTVLSLAGVRPPGWMQGGAIMGPYEAKAPAWLHGLRGRMDERYDVVRSIRDHRYVYVRNFMPHRPHGQHVAYMFETPTTQVWKKRYDQGRLTSAQEYFWGPKAPEELYDLQADPDEVINLADSPEHAEVLARMRKGLREHLLAVRDVGLLAEDEMHTRSKGTTPYELGHDRARYPLEQILAMAELASGLEPKALAELKRGLSGEADSAVRYWAAMGILMRGEDAVGSAAEELWRALTDSAPAVRIVAAEALGQFASQPRRDAALTVLADHANVRRHGLYTAMQALNAIDALGPKAQALRGELAALPRTDPSVHARMEECIPKLMRAILPE